MKNPLRPLLLSAALPLITLAAFALIAPAQSREDKRSEGEKLYEKAVDIVSENEPSLADPKVRQAWLKAWGRKYHAFGTLDTEDGIKRALKEMLDSVGGTIDKNYHPYERIFHLRYGKFSHFYGAGFHPEIRDEDALLKSLPANASFAQVLSALKISDKHPLQVSTFSTGGPLDKADRKVFSGDRIAAINGKPTIGMTLEEVFRELGGDGRTTPITLTIARDDGKGGITQFDVTIKPGQGPVPPVFSQMLADGTAYLRIRELDTDRSSFTETVGAALAAVRTARGLIIDLRDCHGYSDSQSEHIAHFLLPEGTIFTEQYRLGDRIREHRRMLSAFSALAKGPMWSINRAQDGYYIGERIPLLLPATTPIVILVNKGSGDAAELLAGALRYNQGAKAARPVKVVGEATGGAKTLGIEHFELSKGKYIALRTRRFIPGEAPANFSGITPDVAVAPSQAGQSDQQYQRACDELKKLVK